jgi:hypothetical protein
MAIDGFYEKIATFFEVHTALAITLAVLLGCIGIIVLALCLVGLVKACKSCNRTGTYYVRDATDEFDIDMGRYESIPLENRGQIFEPRPSIPKPRPPPRHGVKVMLTDECGNLPSYTLRSRAVGGGDDKFTTYYTYRVGRETEL